jgi:23S rRNA (uridine2552-2'-O)-methyltransferase
MSKDKDTPDWKKAVIKPRNAVRIKAKHNRTTSSTRWLNRQANDPYVAAAKEMGYRSRAAFKLLELNEQFQFLKPGAKIADLGAAPGGWMQVALPLIGKKGKIVAIDIQEIEPMEGVQIFKADIKDLKTIDLVKNALGGEADVVMSDMAPASTGDNDTDHIRVVMLAELALELAREILKPGGWFICKIWQGGVAGELRDLLRKHFVKVKFVKPGSSRADSSETFLVAQGFRK